MDRPRVRFLAFGPARPVEEDQHRGLSRLDLRIVAVLQYLNPGNRAVGEGRPDLPLNAIGHCFVHAVLRQGPIIPCHLPENSNARVRRRRWIFAAATAQRWRNPGSRQSTISGRAALGMAPTTALER